jgi:hypothetical protein
MRKWVGAFGAGLCLGMVVALLVGAPAQAQTNAQNIALKSGESLELHGVSWTTNCRSILVGTPEVEVLEGPTELSLEVKPGMIMARRQNCPSPVPGGTVVATAKEIKAPMEAKLIYRVKYKTKDGDRQQSHIYNVSLFP